MLQILKNVANFEKCCKFWKMLQILKNVLCEPNFRRFALSLTDSDPRFHQQNWRTFPATRSSVFQIISKKFQRDKNVKKRRPRMRRKWRMLKRTRLHILLGAYVSTFFSRLLSRHEQIWPSSVFDVLYVRTLKRRLQSCNPFLVKTGVCLRFLCWKLPTQAKQAWRKSHMFECMLCMFWTYLACIF